MYLTLERKVETKMRGNGVEQIAINQTEPSKISGLSTIAEPDIFTATIWTVEKSKMIILSGKRLKELFEMNNDIRYRIIRGIATIISKRLKAIELKFVEVLREKK